jgi:hypothetical protein
MNKRWPSAIALAAAAWYASDSLRHRREQGDGYDLRGEELEVGSEEFLRATEAITMARSRTATTSSCSSTATRSSRR